MIKIGLSVICLVLAFQGLASPVVHKTIVAVYRHSPPQMVVKGHDFSGPLVDIIEEAVAQMDCHMLWRSLDGQRAWESLERGSVDIIPHVEKIETRKSALYLGPLVKYPTVYFAVPADGVTVDRYKDLYNLQVGVKHPILADKRIQQITSPHYVDLAHGLIEGKIQAAAILDRSAFEDAVLGRGYRGGQIVYSPYFYKPSPGRSYYAFSKASRHRHKFEHLSWIISRMVASGRVGEIYRSYGLQEKM